MYTRYNNDVKQRINDAERQTRRAEYGTSAKGSSRLRWLPLHYIIHPYLVTGILRLGTVSSQRKAIVARCLRDDEFESPISDKFYYFSLDLSTTRNINWRDLEFNVLCHIHTIINSEFWISGGSEEGKKLAYQLRLWRDSVTSLKNRRSNVIQH